MHVCGKENNSRVESALVNLPECHGSRERQHRCVYGNLRISFIEPAFGAGFGRIKKNAPGR